MDQDATQRGGDDAPSFEEFFVDRSAAATRLAYLLSGDLHVAEDAAAAAFANVYVSWDRGIRNPPAYLRRAVVNEVNSRFRRRGVERAHLHQVADAPTRPAGFDDDLATQDEVVRAVAALPPRQRAVVVLRYYEDLSEAEIAAAMGISTGTVKSNAARALDRLRRELDCCDAPLAA